MPYDTRRSVPLHRLRRLLLTFLVLALSSAVGRLAIDAPFGLRGEYFSGARGAAARPTWTTIDRDVSTAAVATNWVSDPPATFWVRWFGYLTITEAGRYTFAVESDDGSTLSIDGQRVIDNGGVHGPINVTGTIDLTAGVHAVLIEYEQAGGGYSLRWQWAHGDAALGPVPVWQMSPKRLTAAQVRLARALDAAVLATSVLAALFALAWTWTDRVWLGACVAAWPRLATLVLFAVLTIAETWPLASNPARLSRNDNSDTVLNEWTIGWVAHQVVRAPQRLFDANIFYPERRTLAYSESMIVQSAMAAPVLWLGGSPVLAYNLVLLAGFTLSGWAMTLVLARWTGSWVAAITGGVIFAFNAHSFTRLPHLQAQHVEFLPFALLALDTLLTTPGLRPAIRLAVWFALQALTSIYLLVFTAVALTVAALSRPADWRGARLRPVVRSAMVAAGLAAVALAPYLLPYWRVYAETGLTRSLADAARFAVTWPAYLATPARWHFATWSAGFFDGNALFPGVVAVALTLAAVARRIAFTDPRARMGLAFGLVGLYLSFGPRAPGYATLYAALPLLHAVRAVSRFGYLVIVATAVLAAFGLADMLRRTTSRRTRLALALCPLVAALELSPAPVGYTRFDGIPAIYDRLRDDPAAVVVEFPFYRQGAEFHHAAYMLNSTRHWRPLINGYSGFQPLSFHAASDALYAFPEGPWLAFLRQRGVTHLFVHLSTYPLAVVNQLDAMPELEKATEADGIVLYRLRPAT